MFVPPLQESTLEQRGSKEHECAAGTTSVNMTTNSIFSCTFAFNVIMDTNAVQYCIALSNLLHNASCMKEFRVPVSVCVCVCVGGCQLV